MKTLTTLIKLHKRTLDELRRKMVLLENQKVQLQQAIVRIDQEMHREMALAAEQPEMSNFFGDYAQRIKKRKQEIAHEIRVLDMQMEKLREEISEAFAEIKKFEIAKENALKRAAEERNRKEAIMMDEIAVQQYQRKQGES